MAAAAVLGGLLGLTGCGDERPDVDVSGAAGPDAPVDQDVKVLQVQL